MNLVWCFVLALAALPPVYSPTPLTDPIVQIHWNKAWSLGFCLPRHQILAVVPVKDLGSAGTAGAPEVVFNVLRCTGGDYCSDSASLRAAAKILRKEPGARGTLLLLLWVGQAPAHKLAPYYFDSKLNTQNVHVPLPRNFLQEGKLCPADKDGWRSLAVEQNPGCSQALGTPVLQGPIKAGAFGGEALAGMIAGCDAEGHLQVVPAAQLQRMFSHVSEPATTVEVTALQFQRDAEALVNYLKQRGYPVYWVTPEFTRPDDNLYRVEVGPFQTDGDAEKARASLIKEGFKPRIVH